MKIFKPFVVLVFTFHAIAIHAQKNEIGLETGFGNSYVDNTSGIVLPSFENISDNGNYFRLGCSYSYVPEGAMFGLKSGVNFSQRKGKNGKLNYLRLPLGLDFSFGNKIQFILGSGLFFSYLISYNGFSNDPDFQETKKDFQWGWYINSGIGFTISEQYKLSITYQNWADITEIFSYNWPLNGGGYTQKEMKGTDGFILLSIIYSWSKN